MRCLSTILLIALGLFVGSRQTQAEGMCEGKVSTGLVLAIDVSSSVERHEWVWQAGGYARAFLSPRVLEAIASNPCGIGIVVMQWSGPGSQQVVIPWRVLQGQASTIEFASELSLMGRMEFGAEKSSTSIYGAVREGRMLLKRAPFRMDKRVIDVSGDGPDDNSAKMNGTMVFFANSVCLNRQRALAKEESITVNGLAIVEEIPEHNKGAGAPILEIALYYEEFVIVGDDAFVETVLGPENFEQALIRKLERELRIARAD